ncbi:SDR family oxidoreductase [Pseudooceanicola sediminis]|uniref:SDR family oxidoreductase n=1 Tax=Pseudooceanicola sediminis TaxID=2211117 RepID=A0A399J7K3_9RHOB|nr:SDR family oxidoreductase [Pseudooceanicola sediminis]KAA2315590.1 SDR family oxidoreductase [Puniceibacterium sp. HSS470]RII40209.1 SDR family oxidoreductase [Pseudooceanicola sediminis]|tara:strand:- start:162088 stop:162843 length:756 start_codon:yes stop_codon:yes gene_type:complete
MTDRVFLITGGNRGLGRSMALNLARGGADVVITYRTGADQAASVVAEVQALGRRAAALPLDTTEVEAFPAFGVALKTALSDMGHDALTGVVQNAGFGINAPIADTTVDQFDSLVGVHIRGPFFLTQALMPLVADGGRVLFISTGLARFSLPGYAAYAMMKGAIEVLARYAAKEFGARGISVNALAPGAIETDFGGGVLRDNPDANAHVASLTAMGRVGLPDDIGAAVATLLLSDGNWITGQRIEVSGGQLI